MNKSLGAILIGVIAIIGALYGIISGESFGIGSSRGPVRLINSEENFYEFWFVNLILLYFGGLIVKRAIRGMPSKDKKKNSNRKN